VGNPGFPHAIKILYKGNFSGQGLVANAEISELRWFTAEEIEAMDGSVLRDVDIKQAVRDYRAGASYPLCLLRHTVQHWVARAGDTGCLANQGGGDERNCCCDCGGLERDPTHQLDRPRILTTRTN
jgi:hypothetical protein